MRTRRRLPADAADDADCHPDAEEGSRLQPHCQTGAAEANPRTLEPPNPFLSVTPTPRRGLGRPESGETRSYADGRRSSCHFTTRGMGIRSFVLEWSLALGAWILTATCRPVTAAKVGTTSRAPQVAVETAAEVLLRIAPQIGVGTAMRIGPEVGPAITARIRPQIAFRKGPHVAVQTASRTAEKAHPQTPAKTPLGIAPGTVPGTVPPVVPGMSIQATLIGPNAASFGHLGQRRLS